MVQAVVPSREHVQAQLFIAGEHRAARRYLPVTDPARLLTLENGKILPESVGDVLALGVVTIKVNAHGVGFVDHWAPFGGFRSSGMGREFGIDGVREFMDTRSVTTAATRPAST